jgi:hypothetical protein
LFAVLAAAVAVLRWSQRIIAVDDAYISFRYGKHLAEGLGLVFNEGIRIEGYTNFAWTLLSAAAIARGDDPMVCARVVGVLCYALIAATLTYLWFKWTERDAFRWVGFPVLWLLFARSGFAAHAGTGLETMAVALLILWVGVAAFACRLPWWVSSLLAALLCLTRADGVLVVLVVGLLLLMQPEGGRRLRYMAAAKWASIPVAAVMIHTLWRLAYYEQLVPNTYYAKAGGLYAWVRGASYLGTVVYAVPEIGVLLLTAIVGLVLTRGRARGVIAYAVLYAAIYALYLMQSGGDFMEYRFMWTVYPVLLLAGFRSLVLIASQRRAAGVLGVAALVGLTFTQHPEETDSFGFPTIVRDGFGFQSLELMDLMVQEGSLVGRRLKEVLPPDTTIATTLAGTVAYFSELPTVDQWGLSEPYVRNVAAPGNYRRGHVKRASEAYLEERGVQLYMDHPRLCSCRRPCREKKPNVFIRLGNDQCVRTWYFQKTPELTEHFCRHPEWFVLNRVRCKR